jgi:DmsE family decaheme c-type cytochrome
MRRPTTGLLCSLSVLLLATAGGALAQEKKPESADCRGCHEDKLAQFDKTYHAGLAEGCLSCHKGGESHATAQMEGKGTPGPSLAKLSAKESNAICQSCHETKTNSTWMGSAHERRGLRCTDCHSVHGFKSLRKQLKAASDPDTCYSCHQSIRAQSLRTSHHPVREGLMTCGSCHNPHDGSKPKMIKAEYTNELCLQCHTEKRGPFLWEHAPVRENCMSCHTPHGSNHDKLLVSQQPWLCQRCHLNTRHPGTLYTNINAAGGQLTVSNRAVEHACKNCHQNVHGGNAPSGPYLGR